MVSINNKKEDVFTSQKEYVQKIKESLAVGVEEENPEIEFLLKRL